MWVNYRPRFPRLRQPTRSALYEQFDGRAVLAPCGRHRRARGMLIAEATEAGQIALTGAAHASRVHRMCLRADLSTMRAW